MTHITHLHAPVKYKPGRVDQYSQHREASQSTSPVSLWHSPVFPFVSQDSQNYVLHHILHKWVLLNTEHYKRERERKM